MVKQWKRSLSQSDILSDGQPFDGSNIDATISSRSSHDWDPQGRIDATISSRSSHDWDPQGRIDIPISSRSSHDWDPQGRIDIPISEAGIPGFSPGSMSLAYPTVNTYIDPETTTDVNLVNGTGVVLSFTATFEGDGQVGTGFVTDGNFYSKDLQGGTTYEAPLWWPFGQSFDVRLQNNTLGNTYSYSVNAVVLLE